MPFRLLVNDHLQMDILQEKPNTKRPAIVQAALSLFAERGFHGTSMRDIAGGAGVQEAAIYRHFESKAALARVMFLSVYNQHCQQVQDIVVGEGKSKGKLRGLVCQEFTLAQSSPEAFVYLCENERMFFEDLPTDVPSAWNSFIGFITDGQGRGEFAKGKPELIADMLTGVLCGVALSWVHGQRHDHLSDHIRHVTEGCWRMIAR